MKVVEVRKKGRKVIVQFDNEEQLIIPYDFFVNNYLVKNDELSDNQMREFTEKLEFYTVKQNSFRYLSGRNHSKFELKLKLQKKNYSKSVIENVLDDLERQQLINDKNFARDYFLQQQNKKKGLLKIKAALSSKGVDRIIIEETVRELSDNEIFIEQAEKLVEKKLKTLEEKDFSRIKLKQKLYQFLAARGFTTDIINSVINKIDF